ncbi:helix-turn-helix domain-containing protein [Oleidesulfovibrio sp.]|uniref:helix-turn-helix domain-containing protein n=1 Tax=Oleidesulfovibrio sp. TaxID=2909707 RepID=UPI003A83DC94
MSVKRRDGAKRKYWYIRAFLDERGYSMRKFAQKVGVSESQVGKTIRGGDNSPRVLTALIEEGCPVGLLDLPENMKMRRVV